MGDEAPIRRLAFRTAGRTENLFNDLQAHYREGRRKPADLEAGVRFFKDDGVEFGRGVARISNISPTGALLTGISLEGAADYPEEPFAIEIRVTSGGYRGLAFKARAVRFLPERGGIGVRFEEIFIEGNAEAAGRD